MTSIKTQLIQKENQFENINDNKNVFYGPEIIHETKLNFLTRKLKREFVYCKVKKIIFSFKSIFNSIDDI